jgi:hypothetical protein
MTYYDPRGDGPLDTGSRNLMFDEDALMYELVPRDFAGRDLILVSRSPRTSAIAPERPHDAAGRGAHPSSRGRRPRGALLPRVPGYRAPERPLPAPPRHDEADR